MGKEIIGRGDVHPNGWRRESVWLYDHNYDGGDNALTPQYVASYSKPGTDWRGEVTFYPVQDADAGFGIERSDATGTGEDMDDADITYDYAGYQNHPTLEQAVERMAELATVDESWAFNV